MLRIYIYMLPIAGQTAGPIGLTFFVDTQGWPGGIKGYFFKFFFHGQRRALQLILHKTEGIYALLTIIVEHINDCIFLRHCITRNCTIIASREAIIKLQKRVVDIISNDP